MSHETTLIYTEPLLKQAVFQFWRRTVGVGFLIALAGMVVGVAGLIVLAPGSWAVGAASTTVVFGTAIAVAIYVIHYSNVFRKYRAMGEPNATFKAEESSFTVISNMGSFTMPWSAVKEVWRFPEVWLLLFSKSQFTTLPLACLPSDMQAFVLHKIQASGGKLG